LKLARVRAYVSRTMPPTRIHAWGLCVAAAVAAALAVAPAAASSKQLLRVSWMRSANVAGTPAKYDRVGVIKIGPASARNVLVLEPGTSAGAAYFVPLAQRVERWNICSHLARTEPPILAARCIAIRGNTLGNGVMAARDALDVEVGVRVPVPQFSP
jgi:hypothetical protein